jgi:DNA polymerase
VTPYEAFRERARALLAAGTPPEDAHWSAENSPLFAAREATGPVTRIPRALGELLQTVACHASPEGWALMYRVLWRATAGGEHDLLDDAADPDVHRLRRMEKAVSKEVHKMHAFVRFRETQDGEGHPLYVAWFEPEHDVLRLASPFFVRRFASMRWLIVTPALAARWDGERLEFADGPHQRPALEDPTESLWRTYYASTFNPARVNEKLMARDMPGRYWKNLPEAADIATLAQGAGQQIEKMQGCSVAPAWAGRIDLRPAAPTALEECRRCALWERATQPVAGRGPDGAKLMLVGEQPGDEEDLQGLPFVGPAGQVLDRALTAAGIGRSDIYVTNAVKHFKWEPRGKRRLHKTPAQQEVAACRCWLDDEISRVRPQVIVALGATAAASLTGEQRSIASLRHESLVHRSGAQVRVTYHPSAVLRAQEDKERLFGALCEDLRESLAAASG